MVMLKYCSVLRVWGKVCNLNLNCNSYKCAMIMSCKVNDKRQGNVPRGDETKHKQQANKCIQRKI